MDKNARLILISGISILILDLASKWLVQARFQLNETLPLLPGLALTYVMNPGAAFSMMAGWPASARLPLFTLVTLGALWAAWRYWKGLHLEDRLSALALGLVAGGALGNLTDRIRFGEVVDFILVDLGFWPLNPWPIFNVADSAVCVGVTILIYRSFRPHASYIV